ncbi:MAG: hypothetical protein EOO15_22440, partial [Chitinophagaceae bacterium]
MQEDDELIWSIYGSMSHRKRARLLRTLRRQYRADLTDAEAEVHALKHRLLLIDNALSDYMLSDKQG